MTVGEMLERVQTMSRQQASDAAYRFRILAEVSDTDDAENFTAWASVIETIHRIRPSRPVVGHA